MLWNLAPFFSWLIFPALNDIIQQIDSDFWDIYVYLEGSHEEQ